MKRIINLDFNALTQAVGEYLNRHKLAKAGEEYEIKLMADELEDENGEGTGEFTLYARIEFD